jgi:hypothetical protein
MKFPVLLRIARPLNENLVSFLPYDHVAMQRPLKLTARTFHPHRGSINYDLDSRRNGNRSSSNS